MVGIEVKAIDTANCPQKRRTEYARQGAVSSAFGTEGAMEGI